MSTALVVFLRHDHESIIIRNARRWHSWAKPPLLLLPLLLRLPPNNNEDKDRDSTIKKQTKTHQKKGTKDLHLLAQIILDEIALGCAVLKSLRDRKTFGPQRQTNGVVLVFHLTAAIKFSE